MNNRYNHLIGRFINPIANAFTPKYGRWSNESENPKKAKQYINGLLNQNYRKSMQPIAKKEHVNYDKIQNYITYSPWDPFNAQSMLIDHMIKLNMMDKNALLIIDDTGIPKQGTESVGVQRQYCGQLGKIANCQVAVNILYAIELPGKKGSPITWLPGFRLYLPKGWIDDNEKRKKAGIPEDTKFKTKPEIAMELINNVREKRLPHKAIVGDCDYGKDSKFRKELRELKEPYVLGLHIQEIKVRPVEMENLPKKYQEIEEITPEKLANILPSKMWHKFKFKNDKKKKDVEYARIKVNVLKYNNQTKKNEETDEVGWLIFRKEDSEIRAYIAWGLDKLGLKSLAEILHLRNAIEQAHREMKGQLGLNNFEGRKWRGWYHHYMLVVTAHAFLNFMRMASKGNDKHLPTLPEMMTFLLELRQTETIIAVFNCSEENAERIRNYLDPLLGNI